MPRLVICLHQYDANVLALNHPEQSQPLASYLLDCERIPSIDKPYLPYDNLDQG